MDDLLQEFLAETAESLAILDIELLRLEKKPDDPDLLRSIFRRVHTIKGTCGFLGLDRVEGVAHAFEDLLGHIRDGGLTVTPDGISVLLESLDRIKMIFGKLAETQAEPAGADDDLIARLYALAGSAKVTARATSTILDQETPADQEAPMAIEPAAAATSSPAAPAAQKTAPAEGSPENATGAQTIRINVDLLDSLMRMVNELVLTRNQLMQILRVQQDSDFAAPLQLLSHVTSELQQGITKTRMQPIGNAWAKLPRLIRDLSLELDKKIELRMLGAEIELDRQVIELIKDPLTHMVRNSADHGLEAAADRIAAGKAEAGTITLNAYRDGGHVVIEIADDGRGLAIDRIGQRALANGLVGKAEFAGMTDRQLCSFIFKPGFSTAAQATSVSGRGVGMDVVRTNIEKIGGTIDLSTRPGKGTRFAIKIPLTLAIVSALIVESAGERFAIPQLSVLELIRVPDKSETRIERINGAPVLRRRNRLLPLVDLRRLLRLGHEHMASESRIVVTQVGAGSFGLIVDRVFDTEEIVVKPLARGPRDLSIYSGNTILSDGRVIMILDPNGIAQITGNPSIEKTDRADAPAKTGIRADEYVL